MLLLLCATARNGVAVAVNGAQEQDNPTTRRTSQARDFWERLAAA